MNPIRTAAKLLQRPGEACRNYIAGHRENLTGPYTFAFWGATAYVALNYTLQSDMANFFDPLSSMRGFWPYFGMLLVAPAAGIQRWLFRKKDLNFAETASFGLYMFGQLSLVSAALLALDRFTGFAIPFPVLILLEGMYVAWSATQLYQDRKLNVWLRALLVVATYSGIAYGLIYFYQWYRIQGMFG